MPASCAACLHYILVMSHGILNDKIMQMQQDFLFCAVPNENCYFSTVFPSSKNSAFGILHNVASSLLIQNINLENAEDG